MPEHLRSLIVILALATAVFWIARPAACHAALSRDEFDRRRNLWFGITLAAFLSHNFWLCMLVIAVLLRLVAEKDRNPAAAILFVLFAMPLMRAEIPGVGGIRYLFDLDYFKVISLAVLLPLFLREISRNSFRHFCTETTDRFLYAYLLMIVCLVAIASNVTGTMRSTFLIFVDILVPYVVFSRVVNDLPSMRSATVSFVIGAAVMAAVGFVEFGRSWLLYNSLEPALGVNWNLGSYLKRDDALRAMATGGQAIPYGYMMAVGFCLLLGLKRYFRGKTTWLLALGLLGLGMIASYSRGPWVGAAAGFLAFVLTGPQRHRNVGNLIAAGAVLIIPVMLSPIGDSIIDRIMVESGSFEYRERVFQVSMTVILANPFFGAYDFLYSPLMQDLRQGQGIIDIVNTYIAVALRGGLVGLFLFSGIFLSAAYSVWRRVKRIEVSQPEACDLGRGLLAALVCIMVTIATVSSISFIPVVYYIITGLCVAYLRMTSALVGTLNTRPASEDAGASRRRFAAASR